MKTWKQYLPDVLAVILFAVISFAYFFLPILKAKSFSGKTRRQARVPDTKFPNIKNGQERSHGGRMPYSAECRHIRPHPLTAAPTDCLP